MSLKAAKQVLKKNGIKMDNLQDYDIQLIAKKIKTNQI